ncbi:DUF4252 domain-containing protein [Flavobacterium kingsejongi]|uniref:DUF4252 domain-containing protein n=1 Tax=Flavobacterium kingsejongi TaxID=1678728 RepID=A0A2S1LTS1_9FLAO|nr:DUF4252 domain-containing protein [Flavobacterium kingsejongi]AWG27114.1 hypothetical protein FK004_18770 [Flavobacterium kingsejongi]
MKKFIITFALFLTPLFFFGQTVFDKYEGQETVTAVSVNKKMFQLMSNVKMDAKDKEMAQYVSLLKKLDNLKVYTTTNTKISTDMKATFEKYMKTNALEELMRVSDKGQNIRIYVKSGATENQVKELLMFIDGGGTKENTVLMSLTGNFDLNEISTLTNKMNLPGGEELKKASKKK